MKKVRESMQMLKFDGTVVTVKGIAPVVTPPKKTPNHRCTTAWCYPVCMFVKITKKGRG